MSILLSATGPHPARPSRSSRPLSDDFRPEPLATIAMTDFTRRTRTPDPATARTAERSSTDRNPGETPVFAPFDMSPLLDTVEFARNAWLSFGVPSSLTPTIDPEEVDRRIQDLKTVEQWLSVNLNLLKTSIQTLELQRNALAAMHGHAWSSPGAGGAAAHPQHAQRSADSDEEEAADGTTAGDVPGLDASAWWDLLQRQFQQVTAAVLSPGAPDAGDTDDTDEAAPVSGLRRQASAVQRPGATPEGKQTAARAKKTGETGKGKGEGKTGRTRARTSR